MKPKEVMEVLRISRSTLKRFRKAGKIKSVKLPNARYEHALV
jgi:predicted site-specific integrase-resolvase